MIIFLAAVTRIQMTKSSLGEYLEQVNYSIISNYLYAFRLKKKPVVNILKYRVCVHVYSAGMILLI